MSPRGKAVSIEMIYKQHHNIYEKNTDKEKAPWSPTCLISNAASRSRFHTHKHTHPYFPHSTAMLILLLQFHSTHYTFMIEVEI